MSLDPKILKKRISELEKELAEKEKELEISAARDRFTSLVNHMQSGVFYINTKGEVLEANPAIIKMLGSPSVEETKKINVLQFKPLIDIGYAGKLKECIETGEIITGEAEYTSKWGKTSLVNFYFVPIKKEGKVVGVLSSNEDVTEERRVEEKLKFQAMLLDNIRDFVTATDLKGNITYVNQAEREHFQLVKDKKAHVSMYGEDSQVGATQQEIIEKTIKYGKWHGEVVNFGKNDQRIHLDCRTKLLKDEKGKPFGMIGISTDITLRKKFEKRLEELNTELQAQNRELEESLERIQEINQQLEEAKERAEESDRMKTEFLNNMSHEIRTPMNGIVGFSKMFLKPNISSEKRQFYASVVIDNSKQLLALVNDILDVSMIETSRIKINMNRVQVSRVFENMESLYSFQASQKNIDFIVEKDNICEDLYITTDETRLRQILTNLLTNAFKYTHKGFVKLKCTITKHHIIFAVEDTGIGISPAYINTIFDRFVREESDKQKKYRGTGLGLSISKNLTELLGGEITVESEKGEGSVFKVIFPVKPV